MAGTATVFIAGVFAIQFHQLVGVVCKKHAILETAVGIVVGACEIVQMTVRTIVGKMASVIHTRRAVKMFVITGFEAV